MPIQTIYGSTMDPAYPGMLADASGKNVRSYAQAEATAEIPFGVAVAQAPADDSCILPVDVNAKYVGVVLHDHVYDPLIQLGTVGVKPKNTLSVLVEGVVWVRVEEAVAVGDRAFIRYAAGAGGTQKGSFRKSADTTTAIEAKGCRYLSSAAAGGLAQLEVDFSTVRATYP
jgi:hypothetical protein